MLAYFVFMRHIDLNKLLLAIFGGILLIVSLRVEQAYFEYRVKAIIDKQPCACGCSKKPAARPAKFAINGPFSTTCR